MVIKNIQTFQTDGISKSKRASRGISPPSGWKIRAFQIDIARQMEKPGAIEAIIAYGASLRYNALFLYAEGALQYESHPEISRPNALTKRQFCRLQESASRQGMDIVLVIPTLGHTAYITGNSRNRCLREVSDGRHMIMRGNHEQVCVSEKRTYALLRDILSEWAAVSTSPYMHIGCDESWHLATCPRCAAIAKRRGVGGMFVDHLNIATDIVRGLGKRAIAWADMLLYYDHRLLRELSRDLILADWHYDPIHRAPTIPLYNHRRVDTINLFIKSGFDVLFCPRAEHDFTRSANNISSFCAYVGDKPVMGMLATVWELQYMPFHLIQPALVYGADAAWHGHGKSKSAFLSCWGKMHFKKGGDEATDDLVRAVGSLYGLFPSQGIASRLEHPFGSDLEEHGRMLHRGMAAIRSLSSKTDSGARYLEAARLVMARASYALAVKKGLSGLVCGSWKGSPGVSETFRLLAQAREKIPSLIKLEKKVWLKDRYADERIHGATLLAKEQQELDAALRKKAAGRRAVQGAIIPGVILIDMLNPAPMWQDLLIEVFRDGDWRTVYMGPQCGFVFGQAEPIIVGAPLKGMTRLRLTLSGLGYLIFHHLKVIVGDNLLMPIKVLRHDGRVFDPNNILIDDKRPVIMGDYRFKDYFHQRRQQPKCSLTLLMANEGGIRNEA